jgi:regulatory protein
VPSEVINEVIEEAEIDEFPAALEVARKRMNSLSNLDRQAQERRLGSYLARRGYGWDVVGPVLKDALCRG